MMAAALGCSGSDTVFVGDGMPAASAAIDPPVLAGLDGIPGWKRTGPPERYKRDGLYGYIDGGAEIVLQYGFRELSVSRYKPAGVAPADREIVLEIYWMSSGEAAFGLYTTKLEGGEKAWPGIKPDNWVGSGQGSLVKGEYLVNILAPDSSEKEIGEFMARVERQVPERGTARPAGLDRLPSAGMAPSSWHFIKGPLAAQNESPFLDGGFWGFDADAGNREATKAFSAKYGAAPAVSKLVVVEIGKDRPAAGVDPGVLALFRENLRNVRREGAIVSGRNEIGRWFLFSRTGRLAALVLGEPDETAARARLRAALSPHPDRKKP